MELPKKQKLLAISVVLGVLLVGGGWFGHNWYVVTRQASLMKQARHYLAKPDIRKAKLCLQRALKYKPKDIEACRLMAQLAEAEQSPVALVWRKKVLDLNPHSLEDRLAYAQTALVLHNYMAASNSLAAMDDAGKRTAAYHNIAGAVAFSVGRLAEAEGHFMEAVRLDPHKAGAQLNLATVWLHGTNTALQAEARATLKSLSVDPANPGVHCMALHELIIDAEHAKRMDAALAMSKELVEQTNSVFKDRLVRLEVLQAAKSPDYKPTLAAYQREAATDPGKIAELGFWEMENASPREALTFLQGLPPAAKQYQGVVMMTSECYVSTQDWVGLQASLANQHWGELEFVRHAFEARAWRGQEMAGSSKAEWEQAVKAANGEKGPLEMLLRLASTWGWQTESEDLLWTIVTRYASEKWAVQSLTQLLAADGRTRPLMALYNQQMKRFPNDITAKNNVALTALLLGAQELKPYDLAREVYESAPTNSAFASTYAFSLHVQGKDADALKIMEQLKPDDLKNPAIGGYYGLILKALGKTAKAKPYLEEASKTRLLPEERQMFERPGGV